MTRTVSSNVRFDCNYAGCQRNETTPGPLPRGWGELTVEEILTPAVLNEKKEIVQPEQRGNQTYHLCPNHVPKLEDE